MGERLGGCPALSGSGCHSPVSLCFALRANREAHGDPHHPTPALPASGEGGDLSLRSLLWRVSRSRSRLSQPLARVSVALRRERNARHRSECPGRATHSLSSLGGWRSLAHATRLYRSRALSLHSLLGRVHFARDPARRARCLNSPSPDAAERRGGRGARPGIPQSQARERASTTPREAESPARHTRSR